MPACAAPRLAPPDMTNATVIVSGRNPLPASELAQPVQRLALELAASFLADTERCSDLGVRLHAVAVDAVTTHEHLAVASRQQPQHRPHLPARLLRVEVRVG